MPTTNFGTPDLQQQRLIQLCNHQQQLLVELRAHYIEVVQLLTQLKSSGFTVDNGFPPVEDRQPSIGFKLD